MPRGPIGQKRPRDVVGNAITVAKIATGEIEEETEAQDEGKDKAAQALGKKGGAARAKKLTKEQREDIARLGAQARWRKDRS